MPPRARKPRQNPLIPTTLTEQNTPDPSAWTTEAGKVPAGPSVSEAPICGQHWPGGWESLPTGADYASCEHGEWSVSGRQPQIYVPVPGAAMAPMVPMAVDVASVIDGVTTDGTPVTVTIRPGEPALISLSDVDLGSVAISPSVKTPDPAWSPLTPGYLLRDDPVTTVSGPTVSPFRPKPAPEPVELDAEDLTTGDDVMFMPSGG